LASIKLDKTQTESDLRRTHLMRSAMQLEQVGQLLNDARVCRYTIRKGLPYHYDFIIRLAPWDKAPK
jgi:hypothetical protein